MANKESKSREMEGKCRKCNVVRDLYLYLYLISLNFLQFELFILGTRLHCLPHRRKAAIVSKAESKDKEKKRVYRKPMTRLRSSSPRWRRTRISRYEGGSLKFKP